MRRVTYSPLNASLGEIRLIKLLPGSFDDDIDIELVHAPLLDVIEPQYEALSYVWGCMENPVSITVHQVKNNRHFQTLSQSLHPLERRPNKLRKASRLVAETLSITKNLSVALRYLRYENSHRVVWCDAICINQKDDGERSTEVSRIGIIYSRAQQVIVWLGPEGEDSNLAFDTIRWMGNDAKYDHNTASFTFRGGSLMENMTSLPMIAVNFKSEWNAINSLFHREWFTRLWYVILSNSAIFTTRELDSLPVSSPAF